MDSRIPTSRPDAVVAETAPRPTPTPVRVKFSDVVAAGAQGVVRGAQLALQTLPGSPLMAVAVRGPTSGGTVSIGGVGVMAAAEGPGGAGTSPILGSNGIGLNIGGVSVGTGASAGTGTSATDGVAQTLQQSQDMNLYYLQLQAQVNAQNTQYTALTNVMKAEYDAVKTAIGNIH